MTHHVRESEQLRHIRSLRELIPFLRDELDWPIDSEDPEDITFDYDAKDLGLDEAAAVRIREIKQLRPLTGSQPWGIFWVSFEKKRLPIVVLRRILRALVVKKRGNHGERAEWKSHDLLFLSAYGESDHRELAIAHFSEESATLATPTLRVLQWDDDDTALKLDDVLETLRRRLRWDEAFATDHERWRSEWSAAFQLRYRHAITKSEELAAALAEAAKRIRGRIRSVLRHEDGFGEMRKLQRAFQTALIHDLDDDGFADMFAQTVTYGLFSLACRRTIPGEGTAFAKDDLSHYFTSPFLKEMLGVFLGVKSRKGKIDFDELGISDVSDLLTGPDTHMEVVLADFNNKSRGEDPVIHFYERFLAAYNKQLKIQRGVFYTPQPVVSYIVRSVHELLQSEFGLEDGLASTITWGEFLKQSKIKNPESKISLPPLTDEPNCKETISPDEFFVTILDPATGTATFPVEIIDVIFNHLKAKWEKCGPAAMPPISGLRSPVSDFSSYWNAYVPAALLPRLYGFELMMAAYAIAHMKVGLKLAETGYKFESDAPVRIYLTNSLEPWVKQPPLIGFEALAHEAAAVNEVKRCKRFTVVVGNPPYSALSANLTPENRRIVDRYRAVNGSRIQERSMLQFEKNIQDDYIKFFAFGQSVIEQSRVGLLGYVTNHSYLDGPTLRGMRNNLLLSFSTLRLLDLHGNTNKKENAGNNDENVFDIQQGVAVALFSKRGAPSESECLIGHLRGTREAKYATLLRTSFTSTPSRQFVPDTENYYFIAFESGFRSEYQEFLPLTSLLHKNLTGTTTGFDALLMDFDKDVLAAKLERFADREVSENILRDEFGACNGHAATVLAHRRSITHGEWKRLLKPFQLFPFDFRWAFLKQSLLQGHRFDVMENLAPQKPGLLAMRQTKEGFGVFAVTGFCGHKLLGSYDRNYVFPLYDLNFEDLSFLDPKPIQETLKAPRGGKYPTPEDIFHYAYAVFHSPGYRSRYAEFLKIDFPRLPLTSSLPLFRALAKLGGELVALHLLEFEVGRDLRARREPTKPDGPEVHPYQPITEFLGTSREVTKVGWTPDHGGTVWIDAGGKKAATTPGTSGFRGVPEAVWNFHVGGYQVCEKWLKDRKGRTLTPDDIAHYHKIVIALTETIRLMAEIDETINAHGGWPGAFAGASAPADPAPREPAGGTGAVRSDLSPVEAEPPAETEEDLRRRRGTALPASTGDLGLDIEGELPLNGEAPEKANFDEIYAMVTVRDWFEKNGPSDREGAAKGLIHSLGYGRTSSRLMEESQNVLLTAVRRGVLKNENGILSILARDIRDYERESMKADFLTAIGRSWIPREDAIREFARWLGYARTGPAIEQTARSLINGLIREDRLEADGPENIRKKS